MLCLHSLGRFYFYSILSIFSFTIHWFYSVISNLLHNKCIVYDLMQCRLSQYCSWLMFYSETVSLHTLTLNYSEKIKLSLKATNHTEILQPTIVHFQRFPGIMHASLPCRFCVILCCFLNNFIFLFVSLKSEQESSSHL